MKLLIITQVVDKNHPILGFFHRWIEEFSKNFQKVTVICLECGEYDLPENVIVYPLGKEEGKGRFTYLWRFYKYIWTLRKEYDSVFVHMNQVYVILGGLLWRIQKKKIGLWYMHGSTSVSLRFAEKITNFVFTGSPESFRLTSKKCIVTGHGIDTDRFSPQEHTEKTIDLVTVGRITKSKNITALISVLAEVQTQKKVTLTIVGQALSLEDIEYKKTLEAYAKERNVSEYIEFMGAVPNEELPLVLNQAKIFVHTATNGSLDKAILEAMSCGLAVVTMAEGCKSLNLGCNQVTSIDAFSKRVKFMLESAKYIQPENRLLVKNNHSIVSLSFKIKNILC